MLLYNVDEVEEDIFAFEGVKIKINDVKTSIIDKVISDTLNEGEMYLRLYSDFYSEPLNGNCDVDDLKARVSAYISALLIPKTKDPIPSDKAYVILGTKGNKEDFDLITATNNELEFCNKGREMFTNNIMYNGLVLINKNDSIDFFMRKPGN